MVQLLLPEQVAIADTEPAKHVEVSVKAIAQESPTPAQEPPTPAQDLLQSIRIDWRNVAGETARNLQRLSRMTVEQALEMGQQLWRMQQDLKRKEYSTFLSVLGWASAKARKFINLAKVFSGFDLSQLVGIELTTLLSLCSKKYSEVVEQLRDVQDITQQLVEKLIKDTRKPRAPKQQPISGWKQMPSGGGRYYSIILNDEDTGVSIEQQAEASQVLPHRVIAEGVALRALHKSGAVVLSDYRAAQLEELHLVVNNARELEKDNRQLELELSTANRLIESLKLQMAERASVPTELSASGLTSLDVGQDSEAIQEPAEQEETEATQATHDLESAPEDVLLASVSQDEPVEEAITTMAQDSILLEPIEEFLATTVPQLPDSELVESGSTTTVTNDAVASKPVEPASLPEASDASAALQPLRADWDLLQQLRSAEGRLREIDAQIHNLNSKLVQSEPNNLVERELRPVLQKQLSLRSTIVDQIVALIGSNVIPAYYEEQQNKGRVVLDPKYASDFLMQAQSWADVVLVVGGDRSQLLQIVQHWTIEEKQLLVYLLITFLKTEPDALNQIDWLPQKLLYRALSGLCFTLQKLRQSDNLVDEPEFEYLTGCKFESLEKLGTPREHWVFRLKEKLIPMFGRSEITVEKF